MSSALARERDDAVILDVMSKGQPRSLALKYASRARGTNAGVVVTGDDQRQRAKCMEGSRVWLHEGGRPQNRAP
jgi:hypothetical protein